ncbi:MAG: hypothetical protein ACJ706_08435 [Nitrososphaeraceae archaeon]
MNNGNTNLFSYDIGDDVEWLDAQSLAYLDRNRDITEKILFQMHLYMVIKQVHQNVIHEEQTKIMRKRKLKRSSTLLYLLQ